MGYKGILAISLVFILFASLFGCAQGSGQPPAGAAPMVELENQSKLGDLIASSKTAAKGDTVGVYYIGKLANGTLFDTNVKSEAQQAGLPARPSYPALTFTVGAGQMIPGFDAAVVGMKIGEEKTVSLPPAQAYGERLADAIISVPLGNLPPNVTVGSMLQAQNGQVVQVVEINATHAKVDFNHELAGETLTFTIRMVNITKGK
ncbi:MAG: peptidylprolyl isomerase [Candidatus Micrarchaeota archaeon]|nr:peptidylprolyl isomerase [Candidatus Micrarchaeota archaeon]